MQGIQVFKVNLYNGLAYIGLAYIFLSKKIARSAGTCWEIIFWRYAKLRLTVQDGRILASNFCFGKEKRQNLSYFLFWQPEIWLPVLFELDLLF